MKKILLIIIITLLNSSVKAQETQGKQVLNNTNHGLMKRVANLEKRISNQNLQLIKLQKEIISFHKYIELNSLPQSVKVAPYIAMTKSYYAGGSKHKDWKCTSDKEKKNYKFVLLNKTSKRVQMFKPPGRRGTCAKAPHCDTHGEFCEDVTYSGCFVRDDLYMLSVSKGKTEKQIAEIYCK